MARLQDFKLGETDRTSRQHAEARARTQRLMREPAEMGP